LDDKYGATTDRLDEVWLELTVAKLYNLALSECGAIGSNDFFSQVARCATCEEFDFVDSHKLICLNEFSSV
jgi:hypothetical protein